MDRADILKTMTASLIADVRLYATDEGGKTHPALPGWGCPCMVSMVEPLSGYDAWPLLGDEPLELGATRQVGFVFLSQEGAETMRRAGRFYLWEGRFVGEAVVAS